MTAFQLPNSDILIDVPKFTRNGKPACAPGPLVFTPGDASLATLTFDAVSAKVVPIDGAVGKYTYSVSAGPLSYQVEVDIELPIADTVEPSLVAQPNTGA